VARSKIEGAAGLATRGIQLKSRQIVPMSEVRARYYLRFDVADHPGVLAIIAGALGKQDVSIAQMVQDDRATEAEGTVPVLIITHHSDEGSVRRAIDSIARERFMKGTPRLIRIEDV